MMESIERNKGPYAPLRPGMYRPWRHVNTKPKDLLQDLLNEVTGEEEGFKVSLDVHNFKPEEIHVKTLNDVYVIVEGKHEVKQDKCQLVTEEFQRRYLLPDTADPTSIKSTFSQDGVLTVTAAKKVRDTSHERVIPVMNVRTTTNQNTTGIKPAVATRL